MSEKLTPLMRQYWEVKQAHPDKLILFRMGDFFEMFHHDAVTAAPILGITLTSRNKKAQDHTPMCGVPYYSVAGPIGKLLEAGLKVAICDQIEDASQAKGLVKRAVTRILTPGLVYDCDRIEPRSSHYIMALEEDALAVMDNSSMEAFVYHGLSQSQLARLVEIFNPKEIVLSEAQSKLNYVTHYSFFSQTESDETKERFGSLLEELLENLPPEPKSLEVCCRRLVLYNLAMQGPTALSGFRGFEMRASASCLHLPASTIKHLEIFSTYEGEKKGSLFHAIDRTCTPFGGRLLRQWMTFPLTDLNMIRLRQEEIEGWRKRYSDLKDIRAILSGLGDLERRIVRLGQPNSNARDLRFLSESLLSVIHLEQKNLVTNLKAERLQPLIDEIENAIVLDPPISVSEGGMIRKGYHAVLDELITLSSDTQRCLIDFEIQEKQKTGITSLKVKFNQVFGYYIEVTNAHRDKVPSDYVRKQTLSNCERFSTRELQQLETKIMSAQTQRKALELSLFNAVKDKVLLFSKEILQMTSRIAHLDVITALSWLSLEQRYCRPEYEGGNHLQLTLSRHPVLESLYPGRFVANDLGIERGECLLLTGPNMAGKSTLMRQVALIVIMAQMGSFVPCEKARLIVFDRVLTRIGASDSLTQGLSTFMVEMREMAEILEEAGPHSLVLLDEIGRGTSTGDGLALAQSILEELTQHSKPLVLFASHYHELTAMAQSCSLVRNAHMSVREDQGKIEFLYTLAPGPALKSYGIHVAEKAGLPSRVIDRAYELIQSC